MTTAEMIVREWTNFHPDVPLTPAYTALVRVIEAALRSGEGEGK